MSPVRARPYTQLSDAVLVQQVARRAWPSTWHPGGLAWALARSRLAEQVVLFIEDDRPIGWAGATSGTVLAQLDPDHGRHARAVVQWCLDAAATDVVEVDLSDNDDALVAAFDEAGFEAVDSAPVWGMSRPATARSRASPQPPPPGYSIRATTPEEVRERVEAHRAAWLPAALPWHAGHRPASAPGATSSYDLDAHLRVRRMPLYDDELDLVVEAPNGSLVGCCIAWFDPALGVAEIEPLGVHPAHRRIGLAGALCDEAVARVGARGGSEVFINTGPRAGYPAPAGAYAKAGFVVRARGSRYRLPAGRARHRTRPRTATSNEPSYRRGR